MELTAQMGTSLLQTVGLRCGLLSVECHGTWWPLEMGPCSTKGMELAWACEQHTISCALLGKGV